MSYVEFLWVVNQPLPANLQFVQTDFARASLVFFWVRCTLIVFIAKSLLKLKLRLRSHSFSKKSTFKPKFTNFFSFWKNDIK